MIDSMAPEAEQFIANRRDLVARTAAQELQRADAQDLPDLLHRLAGKLGVFGHPAAGDAARQLMCDLRDGEDAGEVPERVAGIVSLLLTRRGCSS